VLFVNIRDFVIDAGLLIVGKHDLNIEQQNLLNNYITCVIVKTSCNTCKMQIYSVKSKKNLFSLPFTEPASRKDQEMNDHIKYIIY